MRDDYMLDNKKHAVILVNYNGLKDSLDCIDSIQSTDNSGDIQIIFVDNASKNNEGAIIKEIHPKVHVIRSRLNGGFAYGNNLGIQYALDKGFEYITLLNNDTVVAPDIFLRLEENCNKTSIAAPKMYYHSQPNVIWYGGGEINMKTGNAEHIYMDCEDMFDENILPCTFATGCCLMVKADTVRDVGLLDESYFMYCEDTDFCIRLIQAGVSITYVPKAKLWHKVSASTGGSDSPFSTYYMTRNRLNYIKKHRNYFGMRPYIFSIFSRWIRMLQCKDKEVKLAFIRGIYDHLRGLEGDTF